MISNIIGNPIKVGNLEIAQYDCPGINNTGLRWEDAMDACSKLGNGWRLPSIDELEIVYNNRDLIGGFNKEAISTYWSSSLYEKDIENRNAWFFFFNEELGCKGFGEIGSKDILGRNARAVRTV